MDPPPTTISAVQGTKLPPTGCGMVIHTRYDALWFPKGPIAQEVSMVTLLYAHI